MTIEANDSWYHIENQQVTLRIFAKPNAAKSALITIRDAELHIALHAKPHDGDANKELIRFLATLLQVPKSKIMLLRGEKSRHKTLLLPINNSVKLFIKNATQLMN